MVMISLTQRPGCGPRGAPPVPIRYASHCGTNAWQKSSTSQKVSTSRSNIFILYRFVGSAYSLRIIDPRHVNTLKTRYRGYAYAGEFRDFTFANAARFLTSINPDFFAGTAVDRQVRESLANDTSAHAATG